MSKWADLWKIIKTRVLTPTNKAKAMEAGAKALSVASERIKQKEFEDHVCKTKRM